MIEILLKGKSQAQNLEIERWLHYQQSSGMLRFKMQHDNLKEVIMNE